MKRFVALCFTVLLIVSTCFGITACNLSNDTTSGNDDTTTGNDFSKVVSVNVSCDYGNIKSGKATLVLSAPVDIKQHKLKSKSNGNTIDNIIVGDELEVTYGKQTDNSISQVVVNTADYMVVNVEKEFEPGSNKLDFFIYVKGEQNNTVVRHSHLSYIIDENGNLINKNDGYKYDYLYAVYTKENIEDNGIVTIITLTAIYTCDPRSVSLDYAVNDNNQESSGSNNSQYTDNSSTFDLQSGYKSEYSGSEGSEPLPPFMCAYQLKSAVDENDEAIDVKLSFGIWDDLSSVQREYGSCEFTVKVSNQDKADFVLEGLTAEQFLTEKYKIAVDYTYGDDGHGNVITVGETYTYSHTQAYQFPSSLCNKSTGYLLFYVEAISGKTFYGAGIVEVYYTKINGTIQFQNYVEYHS